LDCFAGQGRYGKDDIGSPLIMCRAVLESDDEVKRKTKLIFVNKDTKDHEVLEQEVKNSGLNEHQVKALCADSKILLSYLTSNLQDQTIFVYLDPFALKGCEFETLLPLLERSTVSSTEIVININMVEFHRRAARNASGMHKKVTKQIQAHHAFLDKFFRGDYWKEFEFNPTMGSKLRDRKVVERYCQELQKYLPFTGFCPVQETKTERTKYFIVFCSRHPDALLVMNDIMRKAYETHIFGAADVEPDFIEPLELEGIILGFVKSDSGITRKELTVKIFNGYFMRFYSKEINAKIQSLTKEKPKPKIKFVSPTGRLNEHARLYAT
jgi:three-Cys-motif partner protein